MISIITATYNASESIGALIDSLAAQSDRDFEWVVIDGASTDNTAALAKNAELVRVRCVSEKDFGIYDALNKGIQMSAGDYYLVVGADDVLAPDAIANFKNAIHTSQADIVSAKVNIGERIHGVRRAPSWLVGQFAYVSAHAVGTVFRKDLHDRFGYYSRKYPIAADALFIKRACQGGASLYHAGFVAGTFGVNGVSSTDTAGVLSEFFRVQLQTESKLPQILLFVLRLIKNIHRL